MKKRIVHNFFLIITIVSYTAFLVADEIDDMLLSDDLELFASSGIRGMPIDSEYDQICDELPVPNAPRWQIWFNTIGSALFARYHATKQYVKCVYNRWRARIIRFRYWSQMAQRCPQCKNLNCQRFLLRKAAKTNKIGDEIQTRKT